MAGREIRGDLADEFSAELNRGGSNTRVAHSNPRRDHRNYSWSAEAEPLWSREPHSHGTVMSRSPWLSRIELSWIVRVAVWIKLLQINVSVVECVEPPRPEERLCGLDQQDGLGKSAILESTPEVHARFDREHIEGVGIEADIPERPGLYELHEIRAQH